MVSKRWLSVALILFVVGSLLLLFGVLLPALRYLQRPARSVLLPTTAIITQIQSLNELVTVKYVVEKIVKLDAEPSLLGKDRVVLLLHAVVKAGVDLKSLRPQDVAVSGNRMVLTLPSPRITDCYVDERKTEVWEHSTAFWRPLDKDLELNARRQALEQIRLAAGEQGIQKEALERAQFQLQLFLRTLGFKDVEVKARSVQ